MAEQPDTLNIGSLRLNKEFPMAQTPMGQADDAVKNPQGAAVARARIAALTATSSIQDYRLGTEHQIAPAAPTADLITDKHQLAASQAAAEPLVRGRKMPSVLVPMLTAVGVFLLVLLLFKLPVIVSQVQYSLSPKTPAVAVAPVSDVVPAANTISIPKINVNAPVQYEPSIQEADIQHALENGVVHYGNTAAPGQPGNVAIFGHSSNDWWEPGNFKFVFVLLDKLSPGDQVTLDYQSVRYTYEVTGSRVVEPTEVSVLNPTATPTLTLITCTPPGTSLRRLVVTAKQISPVPGKAVAVATPAAQTATPSTLTSSPSFLDQVSQAWDGIMTGLSSVFGASPKATPTPAATSGTTASQLPAAN